MGIGVVRLLISRPIHEDASHTWIGTNSGKRIGSSALQKKPLAPIAESFERD